MKLLTLPSLLASTAFLFVAGLSDVAAQGIPITNGNVVTPSSRASGPRTFSWNVVQLPFGTINGSGQLFSRDAGVRLHFNIEEMVPGDGYLMFRGTVTQAKGAPLEGWNAFFAVGNNADRVTGLGIMPPEFDTLAKIIAVRGLPQPDDFITDYKGNIQVH